MNFTVNTLRRSYDALKLVPGGKLLFSKLVGRMAPYTGTINAKVIELEPGYARVELRDHKAVRNHLNSIHAVALMNLAELATGLAFMSGVPEDARGILTGLSIEYLKKARGTLTAECRCIPPTTSSRQEFEINGEIRNSAGEVVARARAKWLVGPST